MIIRRWGWITLAVVALVALVAASWHLFMKKRQILECLSDPPQRADERAVLQVGLCHPNVGRRKAAQVQLQPK